MPVGNPRTREGCSIGARVLIAGVIIAAGAVMLPGNVGLAADGATAGPKEILATPAVGGLTTIVRLHFVADVWDDQYGGDVVFVTGPSGTACAGTVVGANNVVGDPYQGIRGSNSDGSGPAVIYIGPGADSAYPWEPNAYDPTVVQHDTALARWCPGEYTGTILGSDPYPTTPKATFHFRISASTRVKPAPVPSVARRLRQVKVSPRRGGHGTIFAVRYRADTNSYARGDVIEVNGPKHSPCSGSVAGGVSGLPNARSGAVTLHIGPEAAANERWYELGYAYPPVNDNGSGVQLRRWCPGTYKGTILYEHGPKFTVVARFKLGVV
jgi:hypothetical protein